LSLDNIIVYLKGLEVFTHYDVLVKENEGLLYKRKEDERIIHDLREELESLTQDLSSTKSEFRKVTSDKERSMARCADLEKSLQKETKEKNELAELKVTSEGKSLSELQQVILSSKKEEIQKAAQGLFLAMNESWEKSGKEKEVLDAAETMLQNLFDRIGDAIPYAGLGLIALGDEKLSKRLIGILDQEVARRTDEEFNRRVEERSITLANEKLLRLIEIEWPKFVQEKIDPKAQDLSEKLTANALKQLRGPWTAFCHKCGRKATKTLDSQEMLSLLTYGETTLECSEPSCADWGLRSRTPVRFLDFIEERLLD
jgi:hypothetical protein